MSAARPLIAPVPEQPGGLMEALLAVQAAAPKLQRDATNEHFNSKFVSLGGIVKDIGPLLTEYELVWVTLPGGNRTAAIPGLSAPVQITPAAQLSLL